MDAHWKIRFLGGRGGGCAKNQYIGGDLPKKGEEVEQFADLREGFGEKEGVLFLREGGVDTPMLTMSGIYPSNFAVQ